MTERTDTAVRTVRIQLPYGPQPYLHANQRLHRFEGARRVAQVRDDMWKLARHHHLGRGHAHITVGLEWRPLYRRRRDGNENLAPLIKACVDGLVVEGVVDDDTEDQVTRLKPVLHEPTRDRGAAGLWLVVSIP